MNGTTSIKSVGNVTLKGQTLNCNNNNAIVCSETGNITVNMQNVSLNGLIYAPLGNVEITAQNLNLNNVIIIAQKIIITAPNVNANFDRNMAEFVGTVSTDEPTTPPTDPEDPTEPDDPILPDLDLDLFAFGEYLENGNINVFWQATEPNGTFEVLTSDDNESYVSQGNVTNTDSYEMDINGDFTTKYIKVVQTTPDNKTVEAIPFIIVKTENGYIPQLLDSDNDGLPDVYELMYGTDPFLADTDGDGLTDYEEIMLTNTDPLVYDSVTAGVSDANADSDGDGISNADEIRIYGTDPCNPDTDEDGLSDYDEIFVYFTDPLKPDTDGDGVPDCDEIALGLDPLNPETFGYPDIEYVSAQTISAENSVFSAINTPDNPFKLSVDITASGYAQNNLTVTENNYSYAMQNDAMLGIAPELVYNSDLNIESLTLKFEVANTYTANVLGTYADETDELSGIKRLNVFKYFEDINMLLPITTEHDPANNLVTATVDEAGTYCLMDLEVWFEMLSDGGETQETVPAVSPAPVAPAQMSLTSPALLSGAATGVPTVKNDTPIDVVFAIQNDHPSIDLFDVTKIWTNSSIDYIFSTYSNARVYILEYNNEGVYAGEWFSTAVSAENKVDTITHKNGAPSINWELKLNSISNLAYRENSMKFCFDFIQLTWESMNPPYNLILNFLNKVNYVIFCETASYGSTINVAFCFNPDCSYYPVSSFHYNPVLHVSDFITRILEEHVVKTPYNVIIPTGYAKIMLNEPLNADTHSSRITDTDNDGLKDWDEVDEGFLYYINGGNGGQSMFDDEGKLKLPTIRKCMSATNKPYAEDGLKRFELDSQVSGMPGTDFEKYFKNILDTTLVLPIHSNPAHKDSDGDGLTDDMDTKPLKKFYDEHFKLVDSYDYHYSNLISERYREISEKTNSLYASIVGTKTENIAYSAKKELMGLMALGGFTPLSGIINNGLSSTGSTPNAAKILLHYIGNSGEDYEIKNFAHAVALSYKQRFEYYNDMNYFMDMVEKNTIPNNTYLFSTVTDKGRTWGVSYYGIYRSAIDVDWYLTVGGGQNALVSEVTCTKNEKGTYSYSAKVKFYLLDYYDWDSKDESNANALHLYGFAQAFFSYGCYETIIEWTEGSRFPKYKFDSQVDVNELVFDGVNDWGLLLAYSFGSM